MHKLSDNYLFTIIAAICFLSATATVSAQPYDEPRTEMPAQTNTVDSESLSKFVDAYSEVQSIQQSYTSKIQDVDEPAEANKLQQEAQQKMQQAVKEKGLSIAQYQEIASQAAQDPALHTRIQQRLNDSGS
jgi:hypothetical protein